MGNVGINERKYDEASVGADIVSFYCFSPAAASKESTKNDAPDSFCRLLY